MADWLRRIVTAGGRIAHLAANAATPAAEDEAPAGRHSSNPRIRSSRFRRAAAKGKSGTGRDRKINPTLAALLTFVNTC
jgi:hypothetical protein